MLDTESGGYVLVGADGEMLFRCRRLSFEADGGRSENFIYPIPKLARVVSGEADWYIDGRLYRVSAGDIAVLRPGMIRHFEKILGDEPFVCDIFEYTPSFIAGCECTEYFVGGAQNTAAVIPSAEAPYELTDTLIKIEEELSASRSACADMIRALTVSALVRILRIAGVDSGMSRVLPWSLAHNDSFDYSKIRTPGDHSVEMAYVLNKIRAELSGRLDIDELAAAAHMSRSHFFKVFRQYNGVSVNEFITRCRIENTVRLLRERRCGVLEAAYTSGFTSSSGFYRAFKLHTGMSPTEYLDSERS